MQTRHLPKARTRALAAAVVFGWLLSQSLALAGVAASVTECNILNSPYPSSYSKKTLAQAALKPCGPPRAEPFAKNRVVKPPVLVAIQEQADCPVSREIQRTPFVASVPPLVSAVVGANDHPHSHTNVQVGFGKMLADNSTTVGMKNGTRLQEPGCLYVKTSVNF